MNQHSQSDSSRPVPPRVSIVMSVRNGGTFLRETVDSVLAQTFPDFEFIVVDDDSNDSTPEILADYARADRRIRLFCNERNLGLTKSLNRGLRAATGEYVARIDADDTCKPGRIEKQVRFLSSHPGIAVVGTGIELVDGDGRFLETRNTTLRSYAHFLFGLLHCQNWLYHPTVMVRKSVLDSLGGYDETVPVSQDFDLWVRLAMKGYDARIISEPLVRYRVHEDRISGRNAEAQLHQRHAAHRRMLRTYLGDFPMHPVESFLTENGYDWIEPSYSRARSFAKALGTMMAHIRKDTGMSRRDYSELRSLFSALAHKAAFKAIAKSRSASLALMAFTLEMSPARFFSPLNLCYPLVWIGGPAVARHAIRLYFRAAGIPIPGPGNEIQPSGSFTC